MTETFSTLQYDNRHLVIKNVEGKNPVVICECYLPEFAETICRLLSEAAKNESDARKPENLEIT